MRFKEWAHYLCVDSCPVNTGWPVTEPWEKNHLILLHEEHSLGPAHSMPHTLSSPMPILEENIRILSPCLARTLPHPLWRECSRPPNCPKPSFRVAEGHLWYLHGSDQFHQATFVALCQPAHCSAGQSQCDRFICSFQDRFGPLWGMQMGHLLGLRSSISFRNEYSSTLNKKYFRQQSSFLQYLNKPYLFNLGNVS